VKNTQAIALVILIPVLLIGILALGGGVRMSSVAIDNGIWQVGATYNGMTAAGVKSASYVFDPDGSVYNNPGHQGRPTYRVTFSDFRTLAADTTSSDGYTIHSIGMDIGVRTIAMTDGGCMYESDPGTVAIDFGVLFTKGNAWSAAYIGAIASVSVKGGSAYLTAWSTLGWDQAKTLYDAEVTKSGSGTWSVSPQVTWVWPSAAGGDCYTGGNTTSVTGQVQVSLRAGSVMSMAQGGVPVHVTVYDVGALYTIAITLKSKGAAPTTNPFAGILQFLTDLFTRVHSQFEQFMDWLFALLGAWVPILLIGIAAIVLTVTIVFIVVRFGGRGKRRK